MSIFDNNGFYPTPESVVQQMVFNLNLKDKVILEPSAGKGDLVDALRLYSPKEIIICEIEDDLASISSQKSDKFLKSDFFEVTKEEISHINLIIANPSFNNADKHILHMWDIAPEGCIIVSLCNWETINNPYSRTRNGLKSIVDEYGTKENLGDVFSDAERKTDVNIGLIRLYKPRTTEETEFEGYFDLEEDLNENQIEGIMHHNDIFEIVNRYVGAVKYWDTVSEMQTRINELITPINHHEHKIEFKASYSDSNKRYSTINKETFKKELQKGAWKSVFDKFDMERYVTSKVMEDINKFVEQQSNIPFTVSNIYKMINMIFGTRENTMNKVIVEVFDWLTAHHSENRGYLPGWKTNSEYIVNKKFIAPYCGVSIGNYGTPQISWQRGGNRMDDLTKALCFLTGTKYNKNNCIEIFYNWGGESVEFEKVDPNSEREEGYSYLSNKYTFQDSNYNKHEINDLYKFKEEYDYFYVLSSGYNKEVIRYKLFGKWYDWGFFKIKVYKKGTMHVVFKDDNVWTLFNREAAKAKGFQLASKFTGDYRTKTNGVEVYGR